jgi:hypothetical protein
MAKKQQLRLPVTQAFWRSWLPAEDVHEINGLMEEGESDRIISEIANMAVGRAEGAAAVVWYMLENCDNDVYRAKLAMRAGERWLEIMDIAAHENGSEGFARVVAGFRADWERCCAEFVGFQQG